MRTSDPTQLVDRRKSPYALTQNSLPLFDLIRISHGLDPFCFSFCLFIIFNAFNYLTFLFQFLLFIHQNEI